jgi:hypothetical protein
MRTHLGCIGRVNLGLLGGETRRRLEHFQGSWLDFVAEPASLVVRHVQPTDTPVVPNVAGELLECLGRLTDAERERAAGGSLYCLDEEDGQYVRLKVSPGGVLTVAWAQPDYAHARSAPYRGEHVPVVFEPYQRLNGAVRLRAEAEGLARIHRVVERSAGLYPEGELDQRPVDDKVEINFRNVNASVLALLAALRETAHPASSLEGEIDVSSFRAGDLEDYCRFVMREGEVWLLRPALWSEPEEDSDLARPLESAA